MEPDQISNATRPSTNHRSYERYQNQTNTSQHNPLLSAQRIQELSQTQNQIQQIQPNKHHSQQLSNQKAIVEQKQLSINQRPALHSDFSERPHAANQQNQLSANYNNLQTQRSQSYNQQKQENKNEQELLIQGYQQEELGITNLNRQNQQNYHQNNQEKAASFINSQAESDLLDFGPTIEEQIQREVIQERSYNKEYDQVQGSPQLLQKKQAIPIEIQIEIKKDIPMDIESQSKGYLTEKESHKSAKIYHQRQRQWTGYQQPISNQSQASEFESGPFYQQKMPQNNSNLFKFGFTITSKKNSEKKISTLEPINLQIPKIENSEQKQQSIEKNQKKQFQNQSNQKGQYLQQKEQSKSNADIFKDSSQKSHKSSKKSQIKVIQQQVQFYISKSATKQIISQLENINEKAQIQQIKDQLPSQIPVDQFQIVSNILKEQQSVQIEFESISAISFNQKPHQIQNHEVQTIEQNYSKKENSQTNALETVIQQLEDIYKNIDQENNEQQNFLLLYNLMKDHINLITLKPIDSIGEKIVQNGKYLMMFIDLFALKSPAGEDRRLLLRYLSYSLSRYVKQNKQIYQTFLQRFWRVKSGKLRIQDCFSFKNSPKKQQKNQQQQEIEQRYSVQVHDASVNNGPKSIMKSNNKQRIREHRTEMPVQRNPRNIKKSEDKHQRDNTIVIQSLQNENKPKSTKKRVKVKKQDTPEKSQKLGFANTFVTLEDKNGKQILQTKKYSLRLLQKSNKQKSHSKQIKKSKSRPKKNSPQKQQNRQSSQQHKRNSPKPSAKKRLSIRRSVAKLQNQQFLTVDYVKSHFHELKIDTHSLKMLSGTLLTEEDRKIAKMLQQYEKATIQQERLALDLQASHQVPPVQQPYNQINQETHNTVSRDRIREMALQLQKNKLKKYKIMQQLTENHIVIDTIIDPDINNHGIYALVKVTKMTSVFCGALYFLIPMSKLELCSRERIDEDIKKIKTLVQESQKNNIGILKPSSKIQEAIEAQKIKRAKSQKKK